MPTAVMPTAVVVPAIAFPAVVVLALPVTYPASDRLTSSYAFNHLSHLTGQRGGICGILGTPPAALNLISISACPPGTKNETGAT